MAFDRQQQRVIDRLVEVLAVAVDVRGRGAIGAEPRERPREIWRRAFGADVHDA